ncbi:Atxe2 family lasso peptide isopeptidase [Luteimonas saliphila]|uniref:Atxe2 family lasso peptide isopeptidase n=1 Tax=Luteimonas saliphila TaxID=2804919 RepID=UPI001EE1E1F0|nr:Atxe2 family lasso peptide isopeptidase [Luteimonas saliphila]
MRLITTDDLARIRDIDTLSISPDGARFAILVRQADPEANTYRMAWYVGQLDGGALTYVGDGGEARLMTSPNGIQTGDFEASPARWSPDGSSIAYTVRRIGEVQLWTSRTDGSGQRQVTRNAADVRDFAWNEDGRSLFFTVGQARAALAARHEAVERSGHPLQSFRTLYHAVNSGPPLPSLDAALATWIVDADGRDERAAAEAEQDDFTAIRERQSGGGVAEISAALRPPVIAADGAMAWLERDDPGQTGMFPFGRLRATLAPGGDPVVCGDPRCAGQIIREIWWRDTADEVAIWSLDGPTDLRQSLYAWSPRSGAVRTVFSSAETLLEACGLSRHRLVCLRETPLEPRHVAAIDIASGAVTKIADVNPEFANFRLGRAERIEWDTAADIARMGYAPRAGGIVLYPPDYDPARAYPLFVAPYASGRFLRGDVGDEHPLLVYAANGFVVLNSAFPHAIRAFVEGDANVLAQRAYDPAFDYPHLTMLSETTFAGMDTVAERANIDAARAGTGGVSHGAFVPLYMVQKRDRFAALSVAHGSWQDLEYHFARLPYPYGDQPQPMFPKDDAFWKPIDLRWHLDEVEAPVLFHAAAVELLGMVRLIRAMSDARLPFEAYSFNDETHMKWQPAHRLTIYDRNLDWFRFWLQDIEDPDPAKAEQYERWRQLRELQCKNPRSVRDYCGVVSTHVQIEH